MTIVYTRKKDTKVQNMFKQKKYKYKLQYEHRMLNAQVNTMMLNIISY